MKYRSPDSSAWPLMISGVRASSMRMLSTSSTIPKKRSRWTRWSSSVTMLSQEVVEPELVVRAVRDIRGIGLAPGDGLEVHEPLVVRRVAGLEEVRRRAPVRLLAEDHPDREPEEVVDRAHPLRVAPGEVVVDRDDVDAPAGDRVQDRGERGHEGLALAGAHLGDLALVEDDAADQLDVEVAHPERPDHRLAGHREGLGNDVVEGDLDLR